MELTLREGCVPLFPRVHIVFSLSILKQEEEHLVFWRCSMDQGTGQFLQGHSLRYVRILWICLKLIKMYVFSFTLIPHSLIFLVLVQ